MCFSATASFVAGTALSAIGVATLRMAKRRVEVPFACVPLLFGVQQLVEGFIWLSFRYALPTPATAMTMVYSLFSHVIWPIFVPYAVRRLELVPWRRRALAVCQVLGLMVGSYLLYSVLTVPIAARVLGRHIAYESPHFYAVPVMTAYLVATGLSSLLSSDATIRLLGALTLTSFVAVTWLHLATMISVWCFFAALLSVLVYVCLKGRRAAANAGLVRRAA